MNNKGFTFIEMVAAVTLVSLLTVMALGAYTGMNESAKRKTMNAKVTELKAAAETWARENNITTRTTISVNALVVEGYISADKVDTDGIAEIRNPFNGDNMICNTIDISYNEGVITTIFDDSIQNCKLAEQSVVDTNVNIRVIDADNIDRSGSSTASVASWTNKDLIVIADSEIYDPTGTSQLVSISYDFEGSTITKKVKGLEKYTGNAFISAEEAKKYYNVFHITSSGSLLYNSKIVVTFNIINESSKSRSYTVRFDKEETEATVESSSDWVSEESPILIKLNDGNGSGPKGFYITKTTSFTNQDYYPFDPAGTPIVLPVGRYYIWTEDNAGNLSSTYKTVLQINNVDSSKPKCAVNFEGTVGDHGWYISPVTPYTNNVVQAGISGINLGINMSSVSPVYSAYAQYDTIVKTYGIRRDTETKKEGELYYCHAKTLAGVTSINEGRLFLDKTPPTITVSLSDSNSATKEKDITINLQDKLSGLNEVTTVKYGLSSDKDTKPTEWKKVEIKAKEQTNEVVSATAPIGGGESGIYYVWLDYKDYKDYAGNKAVVKDSQEVGIKMFGAYKFDNTPPRCGENNGKTNWTKGTYKVEQKCIDDENGTGFQSGCKKATVTQKFSGESVKTGVITIEDNSGNKTDCPVNVYIDNTPPTCGENTGKTTWTKGKLDIKQHCYDKESGCENDVLSSSYNETTTIKTSNIDIKDKVGNKTTCPVNVYLDNTPPTCGNVSGENSTWTKNNVTVKVSCSDKGSGCRTPDVSRTANESLEKAKIEIADLAGNKTQCGPYKFYVDKVAPTCTISNIDNQCTTSGISFKLECEEKSDVKSGIKKCGTTTLDTVKNKATDQLTGVKSTKELIVKDLAGNTAKCSVSVDTQTQYRTRSCALAARCNKTQCEEYKYACTGNCGASKSCNCSSCHTGHNTCKGGFVPHFGYQQCPKIGTSGGVICSTSSSSLSGYDVCGTCSYNTYHNCLNGENTCQYGCDQCYQCCRHQKHGCDRYERSYSLCGCEEWTSFGPWTNIKPDSSDPDTRTLYKTTGKSC